MTYPALVVAVSGGGSNLQALIDAIADGRIKARIALVISDRPDCGGVQRALTQRIPVCAVPFPRQATPAQRADWEQTIVALICAVQPDLLLLSGFMRILSAPALGALPMCFLASKNITAQRWLVFSARRFLEIARTVPELVFALIFIIAFSLGPLPGVLALAIHTMGSLGKLFSEVVENIEMKPVEGVLSTGGNWLDKVRFAALPQVLSNFVSYTLLRFEVNVRSAAVLGFVGAGGIGQTLLEAIRKFYYADVSAILLLIIVTVMLIDQLTQRIRTRILHGDTSL